MWSWIKRKRQPSMRELLFRIIPKVDLVPVVVPEKFVIPKDFKPPEPKMTMAQKAAQKSEKPARQKKSSGKASPEAKAMTGKYESELSALNEEKASNIIKNA